MKSSGTRDASTTRGAGAAERTRLYHRLQLAAHLARKQADRAVLAATGLTVSQVAVLHVIAAEREATQRVVAAELGINESAVTALIRRLEAGGHVERAGAGRTRHLALTPAGRAAVRASGRAFGPVNEQLAGDLDAAEVGELATRLEAIIGRLG